MRRSISKIALALVAVLVVGFLAVSCSAEPKEHVHALGTEHKAVKGTCQTKGELAYWDCTGCDAKLNEQGEVLESIEGDLDLTNHEQAPRYFTNTDASHIKQYYCCGDQSYEQHSLPCALCGAV